jgi:hypothetical protein
MLITGTPPEVRADAAVREAFLGSESSENEVAAMSAATQIPGQG